MLAYLKLSSIVINDFPEVSSWSEREGTWKKRLPNPVAVLLHLTLDKAKQ